MQKIITPSYCSKCGFLQAIESSGVICFSHSGSVFVKEPDTVIYSAFLVLQRFHIPDFETRWGTDGFSLCPDV